MKMKEDSEEYRNEAIEIALADIDIYRCKTCGHPTRGGWVCTFCGEEQPSVFGQEPTDLLM